jgi:hypothetical protein
MSAAFFIDNCETIDECKDVHWTQRYARSTTKTTICIDNERMVQLSGHVQTKRW